MIVYSYYDTVPSTVPLYKWQQLILQTFWSIKHIIHYLVIALILVETLFHPEVWRTITYCLELTDSKSIWFKQLINLLICYLAKCPDIFYECVTLLTGLSFLGAPPEEVKHTF